VAIRGWDREKHKVDDQMYRVDQRIADSRLLPTGASLRSCVQRQLEGNYERQEWWIDLIVMTGEGSGYGFRIREQELLHRLALTASPGYSWIVDPYGVTPVPSTPTRPMAWNIAGISKASLRPWPMNRIAMRA
jgi:hypothetical protein